MLAEILPRGCEARQVSDGGFSVVMSNLQSAAGTFSAEASKLRGLIPAGDPACPDGGDSTIDGAMHAVLSKIGSLDQSLAGTGRSWPRRTPTTPTPS